jgi:hypothetical protein
MPLFLLRDGSIRRFSVLPEGVSTCIYRDRFQRKVHAVLEATRAPGGLRPGAAGRLR